MSIQASIYWRDTEPVVPGPPLRGGVRCDVCVVGGGYTGLWAAHLLTEADSTLEIHLLEAEYAGAGASGHNGGFVASTIGKDLGHIVRTFGLEHTKAVMNAVGQSVLEIGRFCRQNGIDAEYAAGGHLLVATDDAQLRRLARDRDLVRQMGGRVCELDGAQARARIGSPILRGATPVGGAVLNPHKLARGLFRTVCGQGVTVHESTPARSFGPHAGGYRVMTPEGYVDAEKVVIATDAYQYRFPCFRRGVVPVWSYVMVTEPLTDEQLGRVVWPGKEGLVEPRMFVRSCRFTADNRIVWAGGRLKHWWGPDMRAKHIGDMAAYRALRSSFEKFFPAWRDVSTSHAYGGCIGITRDLVPHFGAKDGIIYGYGYCGNGIAASHTGGKVLRDLVLDKDTEYSALPFVNRSEAEMPAHQWQTYLGVQLKSWLIAQKEAA